MIRLAALDSTIAQGLASIAGALVCAAIVLAAALPLTPIA